MKSTAIRKIFSLLMAFSLIFQQTGFAQGLGQLDISRYLNQLNAFSGPQKYRPLQLRYFSYNPLTDNFQILLDKGDLKEIGDSQIKAQSQELLRYFLIGVALPDKNFWVNLRPDSENQIIDQELARTNLGKVLLEADLQLKKDLAKFTSPQTPEGGEYWNKLYKKAGQIFGSENVTIPTLTRPWIVPGEVIIRETTNSAYVYKASLKVMLEQDHLKNSADYNFSDPRLKELNEYSSQLIREKILPKLTKEVNASAKYASLRQVYYSLILSRWFKDRFAGKTGLYSNLINSGGLNGLTSQQAWSKTTYFKEYQKSFSNGEYNIKEQVNTVMGPTIRTYFSGGVALGTELKMPGKGNISSPLGTFIGSSPIITMALGNRMVSLSGVPLGGQLVPNLETRAFAEVAGGVSPQRAKVSSPVTSEKVEVLKTLTVTVPTTDSSAHQFLDEIEVPYPVINGEKEIVIEETSPSQRQLVTISYDKEGKPQVRKHNEIDNLSEAVGTLASFRYKFESNQINFDIEFFYHGSAGTPSRLNISRIRGQKGSTYQVVVKPAPSPITVTKDLKEFKKIGQQIYLDGVTWEQIEKGEFEKLVREQGINGVTTNPPLIKKYLASKEVQQKAGQLSKQFAAAGLSREEVQARVYHELIADLAERVIQVFLNAGVSDATFSIEIDPTKAEDVEASVKEAMEWLNIKDGKYRDYIMVKVLANEKGMEIIRQITAKGGNVNATVLLSPGQYDKVAEAYIKGLEEAAAAGIDIRKIRSVASFFVSRWDVKLASDLSEAQQGKVGNAVTIVAYHEVFKKWFNSARWDALEKQGAQVQKFLAASTGSKAKAIAQALKKKPEYKGKDQDVDTLVAKVSPYDIYVSPLQGRGIINTLPYETIKELMDKGFAPEETIGQEENYTAAKQLLEDIKTKNNKDIEVVGNVLLKEGLQAFVDDYLDIQRTLAGIVSYPAFRNGVNNYVNKSGVDPYSPLPGTPALREKVSQLINAEILEAQGLQISSGDVRISLGTSGLLELLSRIFCDIEGAALKKPSQKDAIALSPYAQPLYNQNSIFGRAADLKTEKPRMKVIDAWDIEADKLNELLSQASKDNTVVIFLDNDSSHKNIGEVYKLLSQKQEYRKNTVIITDISRRFGLPEYNVSAFVTFNKAIQDAYNAAAGGSIAAVSQNTQAGFTELIAWQLSKTGESKKASSAIESVTDKDVINDTFKNMEPDPTLAISPVGKLSQFGLPRIFTGKDFPAFDETIKKVVGQREFEDSWIGYLIGEQGSIPISSYEAAFNKANDLGIVRKLTEVERNYTESLVAEYRGGGGAFLQRLFNEPNPWIVEILKDAYDGKLLDAREIMQMMVVFNIKKMHVGAPGFPRDDTAKAALLLPEERLTAEQIRQMDEDGLLEAGASFANYVFGLSLGKEHVASGFYGSKSALQDTLTALQLLYGRDVAVAVPKPYYVGYKSSQLGAGLRLENINFFDTKTSHDWVPTAAEVQEALDKLNPSAQKVVLLTTPDNPSGTAVPESAIQEILEVAVRNDAFIVFDVAYARLLFAGNRPANLGRICEDIFSRLEPGLRQRKKINSAADLTRYFAIMQTQSKEVLHPGSRLGAIISGNTTLIKKLRQIKVLDADPVAKKAQVEIYGQSRAAYSTDYTRQHSEYLERNVNHICDVLKRLGIDYVRPQGAFYILFRIGKGSYIRFSFAGPYTDIIQVMARLERLYTQWKRDGVDLTSDELFKEAAITSVPGGSFGAPESKAQEVAIGARRVEPVKINTEPFTWQDYAEFAKLVRYYILRSLYLAGSGHANTALSDVEILEALYVLGGMNYDSRDTKWDYRDRFVDKGHAYASIYATLANVGFFPSEELDTLRQLGSHLSGHVTVDTPGIDANTGILGQSLSIALGMAINAKLEGTNYTTFCQIGDGETQEGQIYAAAETASFLTKQRKMGKLVALLDANRAQRDGWVKDFGTESIKEKWLALGWQVLEVDNGHDPFAIKAAIDQARAFEDKPTVIICNTQKGKGVSFVSEGDKAWQRHGTPPKNKGEYSQALKEVLGKEVPLTETTVGNTKLEIDNQEETLATLFNMPRIKRLVAEIQKKNIENRKKIEAKMGTNPHLQRIQFQWDKQPTQHYAPGTEKPTRNAAGEYFVNLIKEHPELRDRLVYLTQDLEESAVMHLVGENVPEMRYRMGIREDVSASVAVGISLASAGRIVPVVATFDPFLYNMGPQLRVAQQTPGVNIIVYMSHAAALDTGADGPTHQSESSVMLARGLNLDTWEPADANTMWDALNNVVYNAFNNLKGRVYYVRATRGTDLSSKVWGFKVDPDADSFLVWESQGIDEENKPDGIIVAAGAPMVNLATLAAKKLDAEGKKIRVICVQHYNVIDKEGSEFYKLIEPGVPIVTAQDAIRTFLGGVVSDALTSLPQDFGSIPRVNSVGIGEIDGKTKGKSYRGERKEALDAYAHFGMDPVGIANTMRQMIQDREAAEKKGTKATSSLVKFEWYTQDKSIQAYEDPLKKAITNAFFGRRDVYGLGSIVQSIFLSDLKINNKDINLGDFDIQYLSGNIYNLIAKVLYGDKGEPIARVEMRISYTASSSVAVSQKNILKTFQTPRHYPLQSLYARIEKPLKLDEEKIVISRRISSSEKNPVLAISLTRAGRVKIEKLDDEKFDLITLAENGKPYRYLNSDNSDGFNIEPYLMLSEQNGVSGHLYISFDSIGQNPGTYEVAVEPIVSTSSPVNAGNKDGLGGIDFRTIPMITQPMGNLSGLNFSLPRLSNVEKINLSEEFNQMQNMLRAGITPSGDRLKEYVAACYQKGELKQHLDEIVAFLVDVCKLEEEKVVETANELKEVMLILDSAS